MKLILRNTTLKFEASSSTARDIIAHYSGTLTTAQRDAFSTFISTLESANLFDKVTHLFLPMLSSNTTECVWDAKTSTQLSTNEQLLCANNELYTIEGTSSTNSSVVVSGVTGDYDVHIGYRLSSRMNTTRPILFKGSLSLQPVFQDHKLTYYGPGNKFITVTDRDPYDINPHVVTTKLNEVASQAVSDSNLKVIFDGQAGTLDITEGAVYPSTLINFSFANCTQYAHCQNVRYRIIVITQSLTSEQATTINMAIGTLMTAFFA